LPSAGPRNPPLSPCLRHAGLARHPCRRVDRAGPELESDLVAPRARYAWPALLGRCHSGLYKAPPCTASSFFLKDPSSELSSAATRAETLARHRHRSASPPPVRRRGDHPELRVEVRKHPVPFVRALVPYTACTCSPELRRRVRPPCRAARQHRHPCTRTGAPV
jgi:hypothetical protein